MSQSSAVPARSRRSRIVGRGVCVFRELRQRRGVGLRSASEGDLREVERGEVADGQRSAVQPATHVAGRLHRRVRKGGREVQRAGERDHVRARHQLTAI